MDFHLHKQGKGWNRFWNKLRSSTVIKRKSERVPYKWLHHSLGISITLLFEEYHFWYRSNLRIITFTSFRLCLWSSHQTKAFLWPMYLLKDLCSWVLDRYVVLPTSAAMYLYYRLTSIKITFHHKIFIVRNKCYSWFDKHASYSFSWFWHIFNNIYTVKVLNFTQITK